MRKKGKAIIFLPLILIFQICISAAENNSVDEYSLNFLKTASSPVQIKLIRNKNSSRNVSVENGVLFTCKNRKAKKVGISGNFSSWKEISMNKGENGVWFYFLSDSGNLDEINYKFIIDGIWTYDTENPEKKDDMAGSFVSLAFPPAAEFSRHVSYRIIEKKDRYSTIEFRIYNKDAYYISLAGDFNRWNPENDVLQKGRDGIWTITKKIPFGTFRYKFMIDGKWEVDLYNENTGSDPAGDICSLLHNKK
ncbi:MAG: hypothetical protein JW982_07725 [Spirochaetes bacterium]|nr:hypothetical protein [Spirochaetota bacterium]